MNSIVEIDLISGVADDRDDLELSVVMPCLNEAATVGLCVKKAIAAMDQHGIRGEVIIADNGSTDGSQEIAGEFGRARGARRDARLRQRAAGRNCRGARRIHFDGRCR